MNEKTIRSKTVFQGRLLRLAVVTVDVDGKRSTREIAYHNGATAVLAQLPDKRFVLVEQFRKPLEQEMLEVVAGGLDKGERPAACARRELREETGYRARRLVALGRMAPAPGYTSEILHLFFAQVDPRQGRKQPDEDERVTVRYLTARQMESLIRQGRIQDGKTLAIWTLYQLKILRGKKRQSTP